VKLALWKQVLAAVLLQSAIAKAEPEAKPQDFVDIARISPIIVVDLRHSWSWRSRACA